MRQGENIPDAKEAAMFLAVFLTIYFTALIAVLVWDPKGLAKKGDRR